ncbi:MAG: cell envelope biogenesis protein OmpA [Flavobacteriaceae bacterium]
MTEQDRLETLRDILFMDDRAYVEKISERIELLEETINERKNLGPKVDPLIDEKLNEFVKSIPNELGPTITASLKEQIRTQRDEVVDALYPIMGKMIKKYVAQEIKVLTEKIDNQFSFFNHWKLKFKAMFKGAKEKELILSEIATAKIEQVFLIEKDSGILTASYSKTKTIDEEMISGMLTAIKSFVEDAFNKRDQNLESIEYELYEIHLQSFVSYYIAVVVSGNFSLKSKDKLQDIIFDFYNNFMAMNLDLVVQKPHASEEGPDKRKIEKELARKFGNAKI